MKRATINLLGTIWTLEYEQISKNQIKIVSYSRGNLVGIANEKNLLRLSLDEDDKRVVKGVWLGKYKPFKYWADEKSDTYFKVINPQHVFSYKSD